MSGFIVHKPGAMTLLQDRGRFGYQHLGITSGGAMDEHAALWANRLLGNRENAALLEITMGNLQFEATAPTWIAVTGADLGLRINGVAQANWQSHFIAAGDQISMGWARSGMRGYLAVRQGFDVSEEFGSCATVVREQLGGVEGRALQRGDLLRFLPAAEDAYRSVRAVPPQFIPDYEEDLCLRLIRGYQADQFGAEQWQKLLQANYLILPESDRMGVRLKGEAIAWEHAGILSEGISFGAVQVPPDGQPIILLKDRQTLGGYPKLGAILPLDAFRLSQARAGRQLRFGTIELSEAQALMREFYRFFSISAGL